MIWFKFGIIILTMVIVITVVKRLLRKTLNIEKVRKKPFSYNHINGLHRKVDWILRVTSMIILLFFLGYIINNPNISFYLIVSVIVLLAVCDYIVRAFFEWKYSEEPKQSVLTITEMLLVVFSTVIVVNYNLLGLPL